MEIYDENRFIPLEHVHVFGCAGTHLRDRSICIVIKVPDKMTDDEFVKFAIRIMELFSPKQPSNEEFLELRMKDDAPGDEIVEMMRTIDDVLEQASMALDLLHCPAEGNA
jgi:hypothetical protein